MNFIKWLFRLKILTLKPGDTIVFQSDRILTQQEMDKITESLKDFFPNNPTLILVRLSVKKIIRGSNDSK